MKSTKTIKMDRCVCGGHPVLTQGYGGYTGMCNECNITSPLKADILEAADAWNDMQKELGKEKKRGNNVFPSY